MLILIGVLLPCSVSAQIAISEVRWAGSELSTADEWLRIINTSDAEIFLEGWKITTRKSDGSDVEMLTFEDMLLAPNASLLISNYDTEKSALEETPDIVTTSVSLPNSKLYLQVLDAHGDIVDAVDDGAGEPFAGGKDPHRSMVRVDVQASGEDAGNWRDEGVGETEETVETVEEYDVRITEVMANPPESDDYEWIEVANLGDSDVNIAEWKLSDESRSHVIEHRSEEGYVLKPQEHTVFFGYQTGLKLKNNGEVLVLENSSGEVDRLSYSETAEGISFGREHDGSRGAFCIPTPREPNEEMPLEPRIIEQSGRATDYVKVTLNLNTEVKKGSLKKSTCLWDFKDGTESKKCNPPSHSWDYPGVYEIDLLVTTFCGNEIRRKKDVVVLQKKKPKQPPRSMKSAHSSSMKSEKSTISYASKSSIEQKISSSKSSVSSKKDPVVHLPVRYRNVVVQMPQSSSSIHGAEEQLYSLYQANIQNQKSSKPSSQQGIAWILLFSQSAIWLVLAGRKLI